MGTTIVERIVSAQELMAKQYTMEKLIMCLGWSKHEIVKWLASHRLIRNYCFCRHCNQDMNFKPDSNNNDHFSWQCDWCMKTTSLRNASVFANSTLPPEKIIYIFYLWTQECTEKMIAHEIEMQQSINVISEWCNFCRVLCGRELEQNPPQMGGINERTGERGVVEIDNFVYCQKHVKDFQLLIGCERGTNKCFMRVVSFERRINQTDVEDEIKRHVIPGTLIITEDVSLYQGLNLLNGGAYEHQTVLRHKGAYVRESGRTLLCVRNIWLNCSRKINKQLTEVSINVPTYFQEFVWRQIYKSDDYFSRFLVSIAKEVVM